MNKIEQPLEDKVGIVTETTDDADGYNFMNRVFTTREEAIKGMINGHEEVMHNICDEDDEFTEEFFNDADYGGVSPERGRAYLSDDCNFGYNGYVKEEIVHG